MSASSVRTLSSTAVQQRLAAAARLIELGGAECNAVLELARAFLEPLDFGGNRRRALDEGRV